MARLEGRWGFLLALLALAWLGGGYYDRIYVQNLGLKLFDLEGDKVYVVSPADHERVLRDMVATIWTNSLRHPELKHVRLQVYVDRRSVVDQFGRPARMDVYLGDVHLQEPEIEAFRRQPTLTEALANVRALYLDWSWEYDRPLKHLILDRVLTERLLKDRDWAASLNWVLYKMLPAGPADFRHVQRFGPGWDKDPYLAAARPEVEARPGLGLIGADPAHLAGSLRYRFDFPRPVEEILVRDAHTAWGPAEAVRLAFSPDGRSWRPLYDDQGGQRRRLFALKLDREVAGWRQLHLRYDFTADSNGGRSPDDIRGACLALFDLAARFKD